MTSRALWVVDTNVLVAGLLTRDTASPPARILDAMLTGELRFLLCVELLAEYRIVLLREKIRARHGLDEGGIDALLEALATNAVVADIAERDETAPDADDNHLWRLLAARADAGMITGDALLLREPPQGARIVAPRDWQEEQGV